MALIDRVKARLVAKLDEQIKSDTKARKGKRNRKTSDNYYERKSN